MHPIHLPRQIAERIEKRRGRIELFDEIHAPAAALVVVDMQDAFVAEGAPLEVPVAREIVGNINRLAGAMRAAGGHVLWVLMTMAESGPLHFQPYYKYFFSDAGRTRHLGALREGSPLHGLYEALDYRSGEPLVRKCRFSALVGGSSDLDARLRNSGVDTLVIAGTLSNVCCESTARDAMMLGYRVLMPADASATLSDEEHVASLVSVAQYFGDVSTTDRVIARLRPAT